MVLHFPEQAFLWDKGKAAAGGHGFAEGFELALLEKITLHVLRFCGVCANSAGKIPIKPGALMRRVRERMVFHLCFHKV